MPPEIMFLPLDLLDDHPDNKIFGIDQDGLKELAASIEVCGVLVPLVVQPKEDSRYQIVSGHRRKHAARLAKLDKVPCVVLDDNVDDGIALVESNLRVRELTPMEKARAARYLRKRLGIKHGGSRKKDITASSNVCHLDDVVEGLGIKERDYCSLLDVLNESQRTLRLYDKLNDLIPELQDCVEREMIGLLLAERLASQSPELQRELYNTLGDQIGCIAPRRSTPLAGAERTRLHRPASHAAQDQ